MPGCGTDVLHQYLDRIGVDAPPMPVERYVEVQTGVDIDQRASQSFLGGQLVGNHAPPGQTVQRFCSGMALAARRALRGEALAMANAEAVALGKALLTCAAFTFLNPHVYLDTVVLLGSLGGQQGDGRWEFGAGAALASVAWFLLLAWRILDTAVAVLMFSLGLVLLFG